MTELKIQSDPIKSGCLTESKDLQKNFMKCLHFAAEAHKEQKRKDLEKTPYINHPIGTIEIFILISYYKLGNSQHTLRANPAPGAALPTSPFNTIAHLP